MEKNKKGNKTSELQPSNSATKRRAVISYANLDAEALAIMKEKYPKGYQDYMVDIVKIDKPNGTFFYAVPLEVPNAIYLVKVEVKIDDYDEAETFLSQGNEVEGGDEPDEFPDDESQANYSEDDDSNE